jgi:hypothetical protein
MMRLIVATLACGTLLFMGGCLGSSRSESGVRIGNETLAQFKAGVTTEEWLLAVLGEPTSWAFVEGVEDTAVLRYSTGESAGGVGAIFSGTASKNTAVVYFIVTNGVVTRFWADRAVETNFLGKPTESPPGVKE